jgi:hypothetical protein
LSDARRTDEFTVVEISSREIPERSFVAQVEIARDEQKIEMTARCAVENATKRRKTDLETTKSVCVRSRDAMTRPRALARSAAK